MDQLQYVLAACIIGGTSEDKVWGETPFTNESPAAIGRKFDGWKMVGTIRSIQEDAIELYGGIIPPGQVGDIVSYMIAEELSEVQSEDCENCAAYGGYCGICQGTYWDKNTYAK